MVDQDLRLRRSGEVVEQSSCATIEVASIGELGVDVRVGNDLTQT